MMTQEQKARQLRRAVEGDADALQELIVDYHGALCRAVQRRMGARLRRHVDAEDVLQQAYIAAFRSVRRASFDAPGAFYKWLEQIALDRLRDAKRDLRRQKHDIGRNLSGAGAAATTSHVALVERLTADQSTPSRQPTRSRLDHSSGACATGGHFAD